MFLYTSPNTKSSKDPYSYNSLYGGYMSAYNSEAQELFFSNQLEKDFSFEVSNAQLTITCNSIFNNNNQIYFVGAYSYFIMFPNPILN